MVTILGSVPNIPLLEWDFLSVISLTHCYGKLHELVEQENNDSRTQNVANDKVNDILSRFIPR